MCLMSPANFLEHSLFPTHIYSNKKKDFPIGVNLIDKLNMRSMSLNSGLIALTQDCIKKKLRIYFVLLQTALWGFS